MIYTRLITVAASVLLTSYNTATGAPASPQEATSEPAMPEATAAAIIGPDVAYHQGNHYQNNQYGIVAPGIANPTNNVNGGVNFNANVGQPGFGAGSPALGNVVTAPVYGAPIAAAPIYTAPYGATDIAAATFACNVIEVNRGLGLAALAAPGTMLVQLSRAFQGQAMNIAERDIVGGLGGISVILVNSNILTSVPTITPFAGTWSQFLMGVNPAASYLSLDLNNLLNANSITTTTLTSTTARELNLNLAFNLAPEFCARQVTEIRNQQVAAGLSGAAMMSQEVLMEKAGCANQAVVQNVRAWMDAQGYVHAF
ncbi:hypothetical protein HDU76_010703 [Blyttiomyces sp. JEL0837]|nr:hypothetical protein HDU76_010703 [Blyttiomyces sp. JEL0837]